MALPLTEPSRPCIRSRISVTFVRLAEGAYKLIRLRTLLARRDRNAEGCRNSDSRLRQPPRIQRRLCVELGLAPACRRLRARVGLSVCYMLAPVRRSATPRARHRVVAHDRRGHGRSTQTGEGHDMDHYADDLAALTAHLDLTEVAHVGHSTGGGEVAHYLARHGTVRVAWQER